MWKCVHVHILSKFRRHNKLHEQVIDSQFQTSNPPEVYPICVCTYIGLWKILFVAKASKNIDFAFPLIKWHIIDLRFLLNGSAEGKLYQWGRLGTIYLIAQFPEWENSQYELTWIYKQWLNIDNIMGMGISLV